MVAIFAQGAPQKSALSLLTGLEFSVVLRLSIRASSFSFWPAAFSI
jgi:hypothetical protein